MSTRPGSTSSSLAGEPALLGGGHEERAGWMHKWTNYLKGYRQRWFVLDSNGILSYYRNQQEVGESCRGSINLQEARILSDKVTHNIVISASSQTFHLKASNENDQQQWLHSLEHARHRAIKEAESEEDNDATSPEDKAAALAASNRVLSAKLDSLRTCHNLIAKHAEEFAKSGQNMDRKTLNERAGLFKITTQALVRAAEEFVEMSEKESKTITRMLHNEQQQRLRLGDQLEQLALQHSHLERAAAASRRDNLDTLTAYSDCDEFHDAEEDFVVNESNCSASDESMSAQVVPAAQPERLTLPSFGSRDAATPAFTSKEMEGGGQGKVVRNYDSSGYAFPPYESGGKGKKMKRRTGVPARPDLPLNLWSIMRNCIGKELSKIPMPVNFSEPLSVLQRITEDLEYAHILESAADKDPLVQLCHVAAFAVSNYSTTCDRTTKPFNPLLGETYECDRMDDLGWRSVAEQVSHHPPAAAHHAEGHGWVMFQDFAIASRFRGKYLSVIPVGQTHVHFPGTNNHYSYKKVTTTVHNIIVGKLWIDNHGEMEIVNHGTGDRCLLKFVPYSYFSRDTPKKVHGVVRDAEGVVKYVVQGTWDGHMDMLKVTKASQSKGEKSKFDTESATRLWTVNEKYPGNEDMHHFTRLAIELNEEEDGVAPTDSRLRPDQRLMEDGEWDEANKKKLEIEEKQRAVRKKREAEAERAMQQGLSYEEYQPMWFTKTQDELTGALIHKYNGEYWQCKQKGDWTKCPKLF